MDQTLAMHTAARRFCSDQFAHWADEYTRLDHAGKTRADGAPGEYSEQAYRLFPRYRLDDAIQTEIERSTGQGFQSVGEVRRSLLNAGRLALSELIQQFQRSPVAVAALNDELKSFENYIENLESDELGRVGALPYRRVLQDSEGKHLWEKLDTTWSTAGHYWYPLSECDPSINVIAFHSELWQARGGTSILLDALREHGVERCFTLGEGSTHYEVDLSLVDPIYGGLEVFVTSDFKWLLYVSHESSITVAGWLADFFRAYWPDWERITYGGPFHTGDLRGSWGDLKR